MEDAKSLGEMMKEAMEADHAGKRRATVLGVELVELVRLTDDSFSSPIVAIDAEGDPVFGTLVAIFFKSGGVMLTLTTYIGNASTTVSVKGDTLGVAEDLLLGAALPLAAASASGMDAVVKSLRKSRDADAPRP